jgi:hypothetical protein
MTAQSVARRLQLLGLFLIIFGARLRLIGQCGDALLSRDQWHAEGLTIFMPWIEGKSDAQALFAPPNDTGLSLPG